jgi:hypothetical protein
MPPPVLAEFEAIVTKLRLAVPPPELRDAAASREPPALFPEIVLLVMVTVPALVPMPPPKPLALFPEIVLLVMVSVAGDPDAAAGAGAISRDRAVGDGHRAAGVFDAAADAAGAISRDRAVGDGQVARRSRCRRRPRRYFPRSCCW